MAWNQHLSNLRDVLAELIFETREIRAVSQDAGLPLAQLDWNGKPYVVWHEVLRQADLRNRVDAVVSAASHLYPENERLQLLLSQPLDNTKGPDIENAVDWLSEDDEQTLEKIVGEQSTLLPISFLMSGVEKSRSVARIVRGDGLTGTGFLTNNNLLVTNHHVLEDKQQAAAAVVQFNVQQSVHRLDHQPVEIRCEPEQGFLTSETDDWTLVRMADDANAEWGAIPIAPASTAKKQRVIIIQHPGGGPKAIALYHNLVTYADSSRVQYLTDTMPGSSGSPVFDNNWNLVAIHHSGGWLREPGSKQKLFRNEGIAIVRILEGAASLLND